MDNGQFKVGAVVEVDVPRFHNGNVEWWERVPVKAQVVDLTHRGNPVLLDIDYSGMRLGVFDKTTGVCLSRTHGKHAPDNFRRAKVRMAA